MGGLLSTIIVVFGIMIDDRVKKHIKIFIVFLSKNKNLH